MNKETLLSGFDKISFADQQLRQDIRDSFESVISDMFRRSKYRPLSKQAIGGQLLTVVKNYDKGFANKQDIKARKGVIDFCNSVRKELQGKQVKALFNPKPVIRQEVEIRDPNPNLQGATMDYSGCQGEDCAGEGIRQDMEQQMKQEINSMSGTMIVDGPSLTRDSIDTNDEVADGENFASYEDKVALTQKIFEGADKPLSEHLSPEEINTLKTVMSPPTVPSPADLASGKKVEEVITEVKPAPKPEVIEEVKPAELIKEPEPEITDHPLPSSTDGQPAIDPATGKIYDGIKNKNIAPERPRLVKDYKELKDVSSYLEVMNVFSNNLEEMERFAGDNLITLPPKKDTMVYARMIFSWLFTDEGKEWVLSLNDEA